MSGVVMAPPRAPAGRAAPWLLRVPPSPRTGVAALPPTLDVVVTLLRDAEPTPLSVLARLATSGRISYYLMSLTIDWHAER